MDSDLKSFAILIPSCDNYADLWNILSESYKKFWGDCPFKVYIITNSKREVPANFTAINVGKDTDWSSNCIEAISQISEKYIIMNIDDLILSGGIKEELLYQSLKLLQQEDGNYLQLINRNKDKSTTGLISLKNDAPYRTSTIFSVWKKEVILDILTSGESPWQFEVEGTLRSQKYDKWYRISESCISYENLVIKGLIENSALKKLQNKGLVYKGRRAKMSKSKNIKHHIECFMYTLILKLPSGISKKLIEWIRTLRK